MALAETLRARLLADGSDGPRAQLGGLIIDELLARPVGALVDARGLAHTLVPIIAAAAASDELVARFVDPVVDLVDALHDESERLAQLLPRDVVHTVRDLAAHPYTPERKVVERLLGSDALRQALTEALAAALDATAQKSPMGGLMGLGRKMAAEAVAKSGALGAMIESKSAELVDAALGALLERVVDIVTDPRRAKEQAAIRRALCDSILALRGRDVARELRRVQPARIAEIVRRHVATWAGRGDEAEAELSALIERLVGDDRARPAGEVLDELGLGEGVRAALLARLDRELSAVVRTQTFAVWLGRLVEEE
jgi:hypothetical protein